MKKALWLALILLLICVFAFSACDSGDTPPTNNENNQQITDNNNQNMEGSENNTSGTPTGCQHTFGSWNTVKQATCKEEGKLVRICSKCSETEESTVVTTDVHTEVIDAAVSATCTVDGKTEGKHCSVCGKTIIAQTVLKAFGHTEVIDPAIDSTCEMEGKTAGTHCSVCSTVIQAQSSIGVLPHSYKFGGCIICKKVDVSTKNSEFEAENTRHEQKIQEITSSYNALVELNEGRISDLKDLYDISYVQDNLTCYEKVSALQTAIDTISRRISLLESYNDPSDLAAVASLKNQKQAKENEKAKYEAMIDIHRYEQAILSHKDTFDTDIRKENDLYESNIAILEKKYSCFDSKHTIKILTAVIPTCDNKGLTEGLFCETCNATLSYQNTIVANGHKAEDNSESCSVCGANMVEAGLVFTLNSDQVSYAVTDYTGDNSIVVIPAKYNNMPVTIIGASAFSDCTTLKTITIPNSIVYIENSAFYNCKNLESIVLPENLISLGDNALAFCSTLKSITVPKSVTSIGSSAFAGCSSLESLTLPFVGETPNSTSSSAKTLFGFIFGKYYFDNSIAVEQHYASGAYKYVTYYIPSNLKNVTILGGTIQYGAFYKCSNIGTITLSDTIETIGDFAFAYCDSLASINVPNMVEGISERMLYCCYNLKSIYIGENVSSIGYEAFYYCENLENIYVNENNSTFYGVGNCLIVRETKSLVLGCKNSVVPSDDSVEQISYQAFMSRKSVTEINISNSVTKISDYAFYGCSNLETIIMGTSVQTIGNNAFYYLSKNAVIYYKGTVSEWNGISVGDISVSVCFYSEDEPSDTTYQYWHYVDGVPTVW